MTPLTDWVIVDNSAVSVLKGQKLSAHDFAYTPDLDEPSTWKLRIDDAHHVAGAIAALGKGFRGEKVQIPLADRGEVKRKVLAAWKKFHKGKPTPEVLNMLYNAERDDDDDDDDDDDESGDLTKNSKEFMHHALKALEASKRTEDHLDHTTDAYHASHIASKLGDNKEAHRRAAMSHHTAAKQHDLRAESNPDEEDDHKKAAHHHRKAKHLHEEHMSDEPLNNQLAANAKKYHKMNDEELDQAHKELLAEKNRRMMNGFMGLTYQNPGEETPSAQAGEEYEFENPEDVDWEQELEGLGLSHNQGKPVNNKDWWNAVPDEYKEAMKVAAQTANRERGMLLQQLTNNMSEEHRNIAINKWKKLPVEELRQMVSMFVGNRQQQMSGPPNLDPIFLAGAGGAAFTYNQQELGQDAVMLPTENTDWKALSEENRAHSKRA